MFGHAVLRTHAHAHAHTTLHAFGSVIHALRAERLASGCRYGHRAARRRLVENAACAASGSRLSTLRSSTYDIAQKTHVTWKTCHANSCAWAWACAPSFQIIAMCLETQLDVTRPKATQWKDTLLKIETHSTSRPREPTPSHRPLTLVKQFREPFLAYPVFLTTNPDEMKKGRSKIRAKKS